MGKGVVEYFASKSAQNLWLALSSFFMLILIYQLNQDKDSITVVKTIFFFTDLVHFWSPIFIGRYLYRISQES